MDKAALGLNGPGACNWGASRPVAGVDGGSVLETGMVRQSAAAAASANSCRLGAWAAPEAGVNSGRESARDASDACGITPSGVGTKGGGAPVGRGGGECNRNATAGQHLSAEVIKLLITE